MYDIIILAIGKIKEKHFQAAIGEYLQRLQPYARVNVVELPFSPFKEGQAANAKKQEGEKILKFLATKPDARIIAMDEHGQNLSSREFSDFLDKPGTFIFVIGGTAGLSEEVLAKAESKLALSAMTFPHEMARLFLCEQIYRAATIQKGKAYHY